MSRPLDERLLDHLPLRGGEEPRLPADLERALAGDARLAARWAERLRQARALRDLERRTAPRDLEGRVVAATQGGHRQERTLARIRALGARLAPEELTAAVRHRVEQPFVELEDGPPAGEYRRAPAALDRRVERELDGIAGPDPRGRRRRRAGLAAAVVVLLVLAVGGRWRSGRVVHADGGGTSTAVAEPPRVTFEVVELDPIDALDTNHGLLTLSGLAGGVLEGSRR